VPDLVLAMGSYSDNQQFVLVFIASLLLLGVSPAITADAEAGGKAKPAASPVAKPAAPVAKRLSKIIPSAGEAQLPNGIGDVLPNGARGTPSLLYARTSCCCARLDRARMLDLLLAHRNPTQAHARQTSPRSAAARRPATGGWPRA
jgi:hypothetical protein